jgi:hypothetical protein
MGLKLIAVLIAAVSLGLGQTTRVTLENQVKSRIAALTPPATCTAGTLYINTLGNLYVCTSTNTWVSRTITPIMTASVISGAAGTDRTISIQTSGSNRWLININSVAESGGNAGSNFAINRYDDAGAFIAQSIVITRSTGVVNIDLPSMSNLSSYANNAAALAGGLTAGRLYMVTGSDPRQIAVVF